jgi:hypothetical protein
MAREREAIMEAVQLAAREPSARGCRVVAVSGGVQLRSLGGTGAGVETAVTAMQRRHACTERTWQFDTLYAPSLLGRPALSRAPWHSSCGRQCRTSSPSIRRL